jgi:hypothetical protein
MAVKRYRIESFDGDFIVIAELDDTIITEAHLADINRFWGGAELRLLEARGDITVAVLKLLSRALWWAQAHYGNRNLDGLLDLFARSEIEGWPPMDGTHGIKLIAVDEVDAPDSYYTTVKEIEVPVTEGSEVAA